MLRPTKRPRLHFLASVSPDPDGELAIARARNDGLLKTRWEHIFARYEKDFEGVGDEISMWDDEIVVDNGHIKSMHNAQDTGVTRLTGQDATSLSRYDGRRLLRAMTVAPSENSQDSASDDDADDILQSIETIADNIVMDDESSDDDLFDVQPSTSTLLHIHRSRHRVKSEEVETKSESDDDSLFDTRPVIRSPSIDDLFCTRSPVNHPSDPVSHETWNGRIKEAENTPETSFSPMPPKDAIHRDLIREEVRKALEEENQAQEAQIEPAWRIPVRLIPRRTSHSASVSLPAPPARKTQTPIQETPIPDEELIDDSEQSLWKVPARTRRSRREVAVERNLKRLRAESEDPLQDGFTSDTEQSSNASTDNVRRSKSQTGVDSPPDSASVRSASLSLRKWQRPSSPQQTNEGDLREDEGVIQRPDKKDEPIVVISREVRRASNAPSSASDTIVVRVPEAQRSMQKPRPND